MADNPANTILIIDDEAYVRRSIQAYLEDRGFSVLEAENGRRGLEIFEQAKPDLVLVDLRMPEVDGLEVLESVIRHSPQTPIIVVSGMGIITDVIKALQLGAWDYVLKPIDDMEVLNHAICGALEKARLRRENEAYQKELEESLRKIRHDEKAGQKIQMKLLPPATSVIGAYTFTRYVLPSMDLSGDFVDYFELDNDHIVFFTADVSGHGVSSALITVLLKCFMRKLIDGYQHEGNATIIQPDSVLSQLNAELIREDLDKHITMFYGVLNRSDHMLTFANGGQFPDPLLWNNASVETLHRPGMAVGLFPFAEYQSYQIPLPDDCFMALFSDGVLEVLPQKDPTQKLEFLQSLDTSQVVTQFVSELESIKNLPDDIMVLTLSKGVAHDRR